jgi:Tfp pilus assembly protein PilN
MQQINLLDKLPQKKEILPANVLILCLGAVLTLLLTISIGVEIVTSVRYYKFKQSERDKKRQATTLQQLARKFPLIAGEKTIKEKINGLSLTLEQKKQIWESISRISLRQGFSLYLKDLSYHVPQGVWLTSITINQDKGEISLIGSSVSAALIPVLMKNLSQSPSFKDKLLNVFLFDKVKKTNIINFEIANKNLQKKHKDLER